MSSIGNNSPRSTTSSHSMQNAPSRFSIKRTQAVQQTPTPESWDIIKGIEGFQRIRKEDKSKFVDSYMGALLSSLNNLINMIPSKLESDQEISQSDQENIKAVKDKLSRRIERLSIQKNRILEDEKQNLFSLLYSGDKEIESFEKYLTTAPQKTLTSAIKRKIQQIRAFIKCFASVNVDEEFMLSPTVANLIKMKTEYIKRHDTTWFQECFDKSVDKIKKFPASDRDRHVARLIAILEQIPDLNKDCRATRLKPILKKIPDPKETAAAQSSEQT